MKKNLLTAAIVILAMMGCKKDPNPDTVTLSSIAVTTQPTKKTYMVGDVFDPAGMVVTATYSDKSTAAIPNSSLTITADFASAGTKTVTIAYEGKTTTVTGITVSLIDPNFAGAGTNDKPFEIETPEQLAKLAQLVNVGNANYRDKYYKLTADTDLSYYGEEWNDGKGWIPIGKREEYSAYDFYGHFDGNNHKVSGLYINDSNLDYAGLFGFISGGGTVKNLGVDGNVTGGNSVGGVAGFIYGNITNCYSMATVNGSGMHIGGVVGYVDVNMTNCYATGAVSGDNRVGGVVGTVGYSGSLTNCYSTGAVSGDDTVGGVAGWVLWGGSVTNCYATGEVNGNRSVGGVAGFISADDSDDGIVTNCYFTGTVSGTDDVGGIAGFVYGSVTNCYFTGAINGNYGVGGAVGRLAGSIRNCYVTGAVSGSGAVGGVVGVVVSSYDGLGIVVKSGSVNNCAALNPTIERTSDIYTNFGRIANSIIGSGNVAFEDMQSLGGAPINTDIGTNGKDGEDITVVQAKQQATYANIGWEFGNSDTTPWKMGVGTYGLPVFYWQTTAPAAMPAHLE